MNIVGLDLSLSATGIATVTGVEVLSPPNLSGCERLGWLREEVIDRAIVGFGNVDLVVIEGYAYGRANQAHQLGELGGVIRLALYDAGIPFVDVPPAVLKKYATGRGNAGKAEVLASAIRRLGYEGHDDNEADALWLREMGVGHYGGRSLVPESHRTALDKVDWPELEAAA